ncbi:MAG: tRNA epoxyqueuosine(34) reductase QueG [Prevotellaceae bacterium]|jgi:epoxyqueuosine reductase|nr:tRNA epoxyqueuosine(34) reductase QueG [Prevotellaceae bacterium]
MNKQELTACIKQRVLQLGFDACGVAAADILLDRQESLRQWLNNGMNAEMGYMARNIDKRLDVRLLVPGAKSVVCMLISYKSQFEQTDGIPKVARYAYGNDYHDIVRAKLKTLLYLIQQRLPECEGKGFVDSAPVLERAWAIKAGLGWIGKNGTLISKEFGSYTFLAELIVNIELEYNKPFERSLCGSCTNCMQACPTNAIAKPCVIDARKCISYQTIEHKGELRGSLHGWLFGCDICQEVCPWNKKAKPVNHAEFTPIEDILSMTKDDWENMNEEEFNSIFKHSALRRTGFNGIRRNLKYLSEIE